MLTAFWDKVKQQLEQWKLDHAVSPNYEYELRYVDAIKNDHPLTKYFEPGLPDVNDDLISVPYPKNRQLRYSW